jgi:glutamyl-tRNA synthetase
VRAQNGVLVLRIEDLDPDRSKPEFVAGIFEDLRWFGFEWQEGPDYGGAFAPYSQSARHKFYEDAFEKLRAGKFIYPCACSRKDLQSMAAAPHAADDEVIYPGTCRPRADSKLKVQSPNSSPASAPSSFNHRFLVPDGEVITFTDGYHGPQQFVAGRDFGDFVVWRHDGVPAYQLAVVADDAAMQITEVIRGADLLLSTARQILLYRALGLEPPAFYHCPLLTDERGQRLAKRRDALSLRSLRAQGASPQILRESGFGSRGVKALNQ